MQNLEQMSFRLDVSRNSNSTYHENWITELSRAALGADELFEPSENKMHGV